MKHKLLLVLPMMFLLTACDLSSIFGNNGNSSTSSNKKETLEQMMNKETITHYGSEKTRDEFLSWPLIIKHYPRRQEGTITAQLVILRPITKLKMN